MASVYEIRKQKISDSTYEANILKISNFGTKVYPPTYEPGRLMTAFLRYSNLHMECLLKCLLQFLNVISS